MEKEKDRYKCKLLPGGHLEITSQGKNGRVWVGVSDLNRKGNIAEDYFGAAIKRFIRHAKSYRGNGKYGKFGGYDITLIELEAAVPDKYGSPACLPLPALKEAIF